MSYTLATMEVSKATFFEIRAKLEAAGYVHAIIDEGDGIMLDMTHIALTKGEAATNVEPVMDLCEHAYRAGWSARDKAYNNGHDKDEQIPAAWSAYDPPEDVLSRLHSGEGV